MMRMSAVFQGQAAFKQLHGSFVGVAKVSKGLLGSLVKLGAEVGAVVLAFKGLQSVGTFFKGAIDEAKTAIAAEEKLGAALTRLPKLAAGGAQLIEQNQQKLIGLADSMELVGVQSATALKAGFAGLVSAGFGPESIAQMSKGFEGVVTQLKGVGATAPEIADVANAIKMMVKTGRPGALREFFTKEDLAKFTKLGSESQRAAFAMAAIEKQAWRVDTAVASSAGQAFIAEQNWRRVQETLGRPFIETQREFVAMWGEIARALEPVSKEVADALAPAMKDLANWIKNDVTPSIANLAPIFREVFAGIKEGWELVTAIFAGEIDWGKSFASIQAAFGKIDWNQIGADVNKGVLDLLGSIGAALGSVDWGGVAKAIGMGLGTAIGVAIQGYVKFGEVLRDVIKNTDWVAVLAAIGQGIEVVGRGLADIIVGLFEGAFEALASTDFAKSIFDEVKTWPGRIGESLAGLKDVLLTVFKTAFDAVIAAVQGWAGQIGSSIMSSISGIGSGIKNLFGGGGKQAAVEAKQAGGMVSKPSMTMLAEHGIPEMVIPMQGGSRSRALLASAAEKIGMGGALREGGGAMDVNVSIPITVNGVAPGHEAEMASKIERAMGDPIRELLAQLRKARDEERRLSYV